MANPFQKAMQALRRGKQFAFHDVWQVGHPVEESVPGWIIKHVRVVIVLIENLIKNELLLRASALAFASVLAIVPFLALMFFIIETFNLDKELYAYMAKALRVSDRPPAVSSALPPEGASPESPAPVPGAPPQTDAASEEAQADRFRKEVAQFFLRIRPEVRSPETGRELQNPIEIIVDYAKQGENPRSVGLVGVIFIITTVFGLMMNIESSFNQIWGLKVTRSWYRTLSDYVMVVLLLPFFVAGTISVTAVLHHPSLVLPLKQAIVFRAAQYIAIWLSFAAMYFFVPNTTVKLRYAILGGIVGGTLWNMLNWVYVTFQYGLNRYSIFYSTLAQFPVLLMWVYFSWVILLFGAELVYAYQNEKTFLYERLASRASFAYKEALGLRAMIELARRYIQGDGGLVPEQAAREWNVPLRLLNDVLYELEHARLVVRIATNPPAFQPARPLNQITVLDTVRALREAGRDPTPLREDPAFRPLLEQLTCPTDGILEATLSDLARKGELPLPPSAQLEWKGDDPPESPPETKDTGAQDS